MKSAEIAGTRSAAGSARISIKVSAGEPSAAGSARMSVKVLWESRVRLQEAESMRFDYDSDDGRVEQERSPRGLQEHRVLPGVPELQSK